MCNTTLNTLKEKDRKIHEDLIQHLADVSSCGNCGNSCGCFLLKQALANLGKDAFLEKAVAGELPITVQELYDRKFLALVKKCNS